MSDPFRDNADALLARVDALTADKARLERERDELKAKLNGSRVDQGPAPAADPRKPWIMLMVQGAREQLPMEFGVPDIKIGRVASATMRIDHPSVARMHAIIEAYTVDNVRIVDLGSPQGTLVNDQRVNIRRLQSGDRIKLGEIEMVVTIRPA
jgi:hypothetical protein